MSISFDSTLSQYLAVPGPRPELSGLTEFTLVVWIHNFSTTPGVVGMGVDFSKGNSANLTRLSVGMGFVPDEYDDLTFDLRVNDVGNAGVAIFTNTFSRPRLYCFVRNPAIFASVAVWARQNTSIPWGTSSSNVAGAIDATASLACAIGARANGTDFLTGQIEEIRLYNKAFVQVELDRIAVMRGRDLRSISHPNLKLWWRLKGGGTVTVDKELIAGADGTAVNAPVYDRHFTNSRRRNRGG